MGNQPSREWPRLALATETVVAEPDGRRPVVTAGDLAGLDLTRVPQELAGHIPARDAPWPRGSCLPPVDTPEGRQALCFGTADDQQRAHALAGDDTRIAGVDYRRLASGSQTIL